MFADGQSAGRLEKKDRFSVKASCRSASQVGANYMPLATTSGSPLIVLSSPSLIYSSVLDVPNDADGASFESKGKE